MKTEFVIAAYRPKPNRLADLEARLSEHGPLLRARGLATSRATLLMRAGDDTILEIFEWVDAKAAERAHSDPEVSRLWEQLAELSDFVALHELQESKTPFPHFRTMG